MPATPLPHQFGTPVKNRHATQKNYDLFYRGQLLCANVHYAICNRKRMDLIMTGNYTLCAFTIKQHI
jgi:hypothetical protein